MRDWIAGIVGEDMATGAMLVVVTLAIVFAFMLLFAIFKGFSGIGIRSNKRTRQARLAVMDAAVVDSRRRLVLVRRDDVEHLIMIGGPTDLVIEQNIQRLNHSKTAKTQHPRSQPTPTPKSIPPLQEDVAPASQPISRAPQAPAINEKPSPAPSPQIRPATKPPTSVVTQPLYDTANSPTIAAQSKGRTSSSTPQPAAVQSAKQTPAAAPVVSKATTEDVAKSAENVSPPSSISPSSVRSSSRAPVLAQASASSAAFGLMTGAVDDAIAQSNPASSADENVIDLDAGNISENELAEFEDNLAMNLGETLVQENATADKNSLAIEMDELLSEITLGNKR